MFCDPLALRSLRVDAEAAVREAGGRNAEDDEARRKMRMFIAVWTRFAEDALAAAVATGVTRAVVLGAGLDTFAYRSPYGAKVGVFEVDYPATQAWKRERLRKAGIEVPEWLTFAPVDLGGRRWRRDWRRRGSMRGGRRSLRGWGWCRI